MSLRKRTGRLPRLKDLYIIMSHAFTPSACFRGEWSLVCCPAPPASERVTPATIISPASRTDPSMSLSMASLSCTGERGVASVLNLLHVFLLRTCSTITSMRSRATQCCKITEQGSWREIWRSASSTLLEHGWITEFCNSKELQRLTGLIYK